MPKKLLEKCCVKIHIKGNDGSELSQGTGVIVKDENCYYVLTAGHCIYGEDNQFNDVELRNVWVEKQADYKSAFERINVIEIIDSNIDLDWVLLKIDDPSLDCDFLRIYRGENFIREEHVYFRGYQSFNNREPRTWPGKIIDIADGEFKITLEGKTFNQGGEDGSLLAKGLSGSGVFIVRGEKIYLIGHLKSVIGDKALNDDLRCCSSCKVKEMFSSPSINLSDIDELNLWCDETKKLLTDKDIEDWTNSNIQYFENINRKSRVLYSDEEILKEQIKERMLDFLQMEKELKTMQTYGNITSKFIRSSEVFEKQVKSSYSRNVNSSGEAKDLIIRLENDFKNHIKELINDKSNAKTMELARYQVTFWLLNCSLEFYG
jgi:hypothetical protein